MMARLILTILFYTLGVSGYSVAAEIPEGSASYYSDNLHGNKTASGEPYDKNALTAAHRTLPFGTKVKVTYLKTGQSVEVVINDRGPHAESRIIDLSGAAAQQIGMINDGQGKVRLEVIEP
jgi:rare lipoprotein A